MARYSRLESTEEKRNFRSATLLLVSTIAVIILLFIYGIPLVGRVASFVSGLRGGTSPITSNDKTPPIPPNFNTLPDFTNQQIVTISGTAEPGAIVRLTFNGKSQETIVDKDGNFIFQGLSLNTDTNSFSAITLDAAGNISQKTVEHVINYDTKPPDLVLESPLDGTKFFGNTERQINIQGTIEAGSSITINDRIVSIDETGKFQYPITLNTGDNIYALKATDQAGNSAEKTITLIFNE